MWDKIAEGVTKEQLTSVILQSNLPYDDIRITWEANGCVHMCSIDTFDSIPEEEFQKINDFTIWTKK